MRGTGLRAVTTYPTVSRQDEVGDFFFNCLCGIGRGKEGRREAGRGCYSPRKSLAMAGSGCAVFQAHPHTSMTGVRLTH